MFFYRDVVLSIPPPLNVPIILWDIVKAVSRRCTRRHRQLTSQHSYGSFQHKGRSDSPTGISKSASRDSITDAAAADPSPKDARSGSASSLTDDQSSKPKPSASDHVSKMLVESFLKQQDHRAQDSPQDIALSIVNGFESASKHRDEYDESTWSKLSELMQQVDELKRDLALRDNRIEQLMQTRSRRRISSANSAPGGGGERGSPDGGYGEREDQYEM
jgi:hypothetical protein